MLLQNHSSQLSTTLKIYIYIYIYEYAFISRTKFAYLEGQKVDDSWMAGPLPKNKEFSVDAFVWWFFIKKIIFSIKSRYLICDLIKFFDLLDFVNESNEKEKGIERWKSEQKMEN